MNQKEVLKKQIEALQQILDAEDYATIQFERLMIQMMIRHRQELLKLLENKRSFTPIPKKRNEKW